MTVRRVEVIFCDAGRRGKGVEGSILRSIPQLYTLDGQLICEFDCGDDEQKPQAEQFVNARALSSLRGV